MRQVSHAGQGTGRIVFNIKLFVAVAMVVGLLRVLLGHVGLHEL